MAKITALTALTAPLDTDFMVVVDESTGVTKKMELQYLLVALDGDHLDIDFTPSYYTPSATPAEADDVDDLAAHLYGIDQKLIGYTFGEITNSTTFTSAQRFLQINTNGGAITGTLPSAATLGAGYQYIFKLVDATAAFTIATDGAETIDGADAFGMTVLNETLEIISDGTNWRVLRWMPEREENMTLVSRKDADELYLQGACYRVSGGQYEFVYWDSQITFQAGSGGSNAGSTDLTTTGWHYLYIDDSAVDTQNTALLDADCFLNSSTAPTWDHAKQGWFNGADRCIFSFKVTTANTIDIFYVYDRMVHYDAPVADLAATDIDTTWTDVTLTICPLSRQAKVTFEANTSSTNAMYRWRVNGSASAGFSAIQSYQADHASSMNNTTTVMTDSSLKIEVRSEAASNTLVGIETEAWILPRGM
jgi:hypothetical protein